MSDIQEHEMLNILQAN